jgi:phosphoserine phosphatase RsbU/P
VNRKPPTTLTLHSAPRAETKRPISTQSKAVAELSRAFECTTGWSLAWRAIDGEKPGFTLRVSEAVDKPALHRAAATALASALCDVVAELDQARAGVWQREAELAAGVPIAARTDEELHLASRLEAVLAGGAQAIGCTAAALYLLDDATSQLKLRACWGLPHEKLLEVARPLKGATADLEALLGHAVVLEDSSLQGHWPMPEDFPAAVCVPVSSPSNPLGTLWLFADQPRDFSSQETNLVEIVAGRIASDLEREVLLSEGVQAKRVQQQWTSAAVRQQQRLPSQAPLIEGWQLAGWTSQADGLGGNFFDWLMHDDGRLALAMGAAHGDPLQAALTAATAHGAFRSHADHVVEPAMLMSRLNQTLWSHSPGDDFTSFFYGLVDPISGQLCCSLAGTAGMFLCSNGRNEFLATAALPLGESPEAEFPLWQKTLQAGDVLVALSSSIWQGREAQTSDGPLAMLVRRSSQLSAADIAERIREFVDHHANQGPADDRAVLVLKRRR